MTLEDTSPHHSRQVSSQTSVSSTKAKTQMPRQLQRPSGKPHTTKPDLLNTKPRTIIWFIFVWHNGESVTMKHLSNQTISIISMTKGLTHVKLSIQTFAGTETIVVSILRLTWGRCFRHLLTLLVPVPDITVVHRTCRGKLLHVSRLQKETLMFKSQFTCLAPLATGNT